MGFLIHSLCLLFPLLCLPFLATSSPPPSSTQLCHHDQSLALLQFKKSFSTLPYSQNCGCSFDAPSKIESWKEDTDCCSWDGVTCDMNTGNVIGLDLYCSMLSGTLHPNTTLFSLPHLQTLDLSFNDFRGSYISSQFDHLLNLKHLRLDCSNLVGRIPQEISQLSKLESLYLSFNSLTLEPTTFGNIVQNLTRLEYLGLNLVNMSSVEPNSFMNLSSSLTSLHLFSCDLRGTFPNDMLSRSNLWGLALGYNTDLTGKFPPSNVSNSLTSLELSFTSFSIHLDPHLFKVLSSLKFLSLGGGNSTFIGSSSNVALFGNLTQLSLFWLRDANLRGEIPSSFGNLNQLTRLSLSGNHFTGQIPENFDNLTQLFILELDGNNLVGQIPSFSGSLKQLYILNLSNNNFTGQIPESLANLTQLDVLLLGHNRLIGPIPSQLGRLSKLTNIDLSFNSLNGSIPIFWFNLPSLYSLRLNNNQLAGQIGELICSSLTTLDLSNNILQGPIPISLFKLVNLTFLALSSNDKLLGELPFSMCNLKSLKILDLSKNSLRGVIPDCLGNFSMDLIVLHLGSNQFQGSIPPIFLEGNSLQHLNFNGNKLTGKIPVSISNCANLEILDLGNNLLEDTFPYALKNLPQLQVLILRSNKIHGVLESTSIASTNQSFTKLRILDVSNNMMGGSFPSDYFLNFRAMMSVDQKMGYMWSNNYSYYYSVEMAWKGSELLFVKIQTSLTIIDLSGNKFSGQIPESIGKLTSLKQLNLSHNFLTGPIQPSLQALINLEALDLSSNSLVGRIPPQLMDLTFLQVLNLSYNHLEGPIPRGKQFFPNESYLGNSQLCGFPLSEACYSDERQPPSDFDEGDDSFLGDGFGWKCVVLGYACGLVLGLALGYVMFKTRKPVWLVGMIEAEIMHQKAKKLKKNARKKSYGRRK